VNPLLAAIALVTTAGAVIAISAREERASLVGLAVTLVAAPFLADPLPQLSTLAVRVVGAALAAYLLRAAIAGAGAIEPDRPAPLRGGSRLGWPAETILAGTGAIIGLAISFNLASTAGVGDVATEGPLAMLTPRALAAAAGLASIVVGIVPAMAGRDALRTAFGAIVLIQGVLLLRAGIADAPGDLEQLAGVALIVATAIAGAILVGTEARAGRPDRIRGDSVGDPDATPDDRTR
jgi:hypothetical protein